MQVSMTVKSLRIPTLVLAFALTAGAAFGAACGKGPAGFDAWLDDFRQEALSQGISQSAIDAGLAGVTYDAAVIKADRSQHVFKQSFAQFSGRMIPPRLKRARGLLARNKALFDRIEQQYGVAPEVIVAIWGLETDFGAVTGNFSTIRALATLAYDCRRPQKFHDELIYALKIVQSGGMSAGQMRGAWAGEIGQTQFMPSSYVKFAVDYDGNGRSDLIRSVPDVLASTAHYLQSYGWQRGQPWTPGTANFGVIQQWNSSDVYSRTIAEFARQLAEGA